MGFPAWSESDPDRYCNAEAAGEIMIRKERCAGKALSAVA